MAVRGVRLTVLRGDQGPSDALTGMASTTGRSFKRVLTRDQAQLAAAIPVTGHADTACSKS